jgi:hypothetical protein
LSRKTFPFPSGWTTLPRTFSVTSMLGRAFSPSLQSPPSGAICHYTAFYRDTETRISHFWLFFHERPTCFPLWSCFENGLECIGRDVRLQKSWFYAVDSNLTLPIIRSQAWQGLRLWIRGLAV